MTRIYSFILKNKVDFALILVFIFFSGLIRFIPLLQGNVPFLFDQGRDMLAVKDIVVGHKLTLIGPFTGLQGVFQGPLHYYLLAIPFFLTGGNLFFEYGMMVVLSLIGVILCYIVGKAIAGRMFGLLLALFFAFSSASISVSSYFWNPNWVPFCMILFYYFLYKSIFHDARYWPFVGLFVGIIAQFEVAFGLPLLISIFFVAALFDFKAIKKLSFWSFIPAFLITFTPQVLFDIRHQFLMTKTILGFLHGANGGTGATILFPERLFFRINEIQQATIFTISNNKLVDYLLALSLIIFPGTAMYFHLKKELKIFFFFLAIPILFFCFFLLYSHEAWTWYWVGLQTSYYFLLAYVLSIFLQKRRMDQGLAVLFIIVWLGATFVPEIDGLFTSWQGDTGTLKNELKVVDYTYHDAAGKPFGEFVYTPPVYDYAYQYLYWWKSKQYQYAATKDKNGIFYLIIEPDQAHPEYITGWKETVIKSGKVIWNKTFPGNITLEKRDGNG